MLFTNKIFAEIISISEAVESCHRISDEAGFFGDCKTEIAYHQSARKLERKLRNLQEQWDRQEEEYPLVYSC